MYRPMGTSAAPRGFSPFTNTQSRTKRNGIQDNGGPMSDLDHLNRILYQHKWDSLQDWVATLDELADLSDDEIEEIQRLRVADPDLEFEE
jgi:hypothetical protein